LNTYPINNIYSGVTRAVPSVVPMQGAVLSYLQYSANIGRKFKTTINMSTLISHAITLPTRQPSELNAIKKLH